MKTTLAGLALAAACALPAAPAHAGRPLQTEDAGVLDSGACEAEGFSAKATAPGSAARENSLQLGCGVGARTQLAVAAAQARDGDASARAIEINGKTGLWQGQAPTDGDAPALTLAYALAWAQPSGDAWRHAAIDLNLAYSRALGADLTLHANLGHARDELARRRSTTWGLAIEHAGFGAWAPMAEVFGDDRDAAWWNLGLRLTAVAEKLFVDASYGRQFASGRPTLWSVSFRLAF